MSLIYIHENGALQFRFEVDRHQLWCEQFHMLRFRISSVPLSREIMVQKNFLPSPHFAKMARGVIFFSKHKKEGRLLNQAKKSWGQSHQMDDLDRLCPDFSLVGSVSVYSFNVPWRVRWQLTTNHRLWAHGSRNRTHSLTLLHPTPKDIKTSIPGLSTLADLESIHIHFHPNQSSFSTLILLRHYLPR